MSEEHPATLDLLLMLNLQADLQEVRGVRDEMHEICLELRAMHRQQQRLGARVRPLEDGAA